MSDLDLWVPGVPRTKGSLRIVNKGRAVLSESVAGSKRWRQLVAYSVRGQMGSDWPVAGPVGVGLSFYLPVDPYASRAGDIDKLVRNVLDALSDCTPGCAEECKDHAGFYRDDVQVGHVITVKDGPADNPGVHIRTWTLREPG